MQTPRSWRGSQWRVAILLGAVCLSFYRGSLRAEELSTAAEIRSLTVERARQQLPVRLRGVVTFFQESLFSRFIQDETAGIYLHDSTNTPPLVPGQIVEIEGTTSPGEYAPVIVTKRVRIVGEGKLPIPKVVTFEELASGKEDSQLVEIAGIVRSVHTDEVSRYELIEIVTGGGRLLVYAPRLPVAQGQDLLDSTVRVRGVCSTLFNRQRQLFAIRLMVPRPEDLVIETPPPDSRSLVTRPISSLLQFTPGENYGHRMKVAGTVTYYDPGKVIYLEEGGQGLEVQSIQRLPLALNDRVEVLGFVSQGEYTPMLQDAVYRRLGSQTQVQPSVVSHDEALKGTHDCRLVRIHARLLDRAKNGGERSLVLQDGDFVFNASLKYQPESEDPFRQLENASYVAVTGICRIEPGEWQAGENWRAKSFRVLLRSAEDVVLLQAPPWWTLRRVLWIAGVLAFVALAAFSWIAVLRRQVSERTRQLETQIQERQRAERQRAIEQERTRVAQDLHDELGSTLTEVSMLGSLARTPSLPAEKRESYLDQLLGVSRSLVTTLDEIVWAVNPKYDSVGSLASYYSLFAQRFLNLAGMACRLQVAESFPEISLDSRVRHGVFLAFKEALNNAIRHSGGSEVRITMQVVEDWLHLTVADNGKGFAGGLENQPGHDGLAGIQHRMQQFGGNCEINSRPGEGTQIRFRLPLKER